MQRRDEISDDEFYSDEDEDIEEQRKRKEYFGNEQLNNNNKVTTVNVVILVQVKKVPVITIPKTKTTTYIKPRGAYTFRDTMVLNTVKFLHK